MSDAHRSLGTGQGRAATGKATMNNIEFKGTMTPNNTAFLIQRLAEALASGDAITLKLESINCSNVNIFVNGLLASTANDPDGDLGPMPDLTNKDA
jgi:hypothetical protein